MHLAKYTFSSVVAATLSCDKSKTTYLQFQQIFVCKSFHLTCCCASLDLVVMVLTLHPTHSKLKMLTSRMQAKLLPPWKQPYACRRATWETALCMQERHSKSSPVHEKTGYKQ